MRPSRLLPFRNLNRFPATPLNDAFTEMVGLEQGPECSICGVRDIRVSESRRIWGDPFEERFLTSFKRVVVTSASTGDPPRHGRNVARRQTLLAAAPSQAALSRMA
jgi:hypothetical protein